MESPFTLQGRMLTDYKELCKQQKEQIELKEKMIQKLLDVMRYCDPEFCKRIRKTLET